jgi:RNA polymerase sigma factor (sigma-70 family)
MNTELEQAVAERTTHTEAAGEDAELVERCLRGNEDAWRMLIEKYKNLIFSIPIKYGATREDAADIFQSVSLELFSQLSHLRQPGALRAWLITVTARKCLRGKRQLERRAEEVLNETEANSGGEQTVAAAVLEELEQEQMVRDAIGRLPERCRQMIHLLFYEQPPRPYAEVAHCLGIATGSVGFIRGRCLKRLEEILEEMGF